MKKKERKREEKAPFLRVRTQRNATATFSEVLDLEPPAYALAVLEEQERHGHERHGDEAQQRVAPSEAERAVHRQAGQGQDGARDGPDDGVGSQCRGGVDAKDKVSWTRTRRQKGEMT